MLDNPAPSTQHTTRFGRVAVVGRPNAGKSTLINRLIGQKISIVSEKPQTTRYRILGIRTCEKGQLVFVDTPGIHRPLFKLNRRMLRTAMTSLEDSDAALLLVDASEGFGRGDKFVIDAIKTYDRPPLVLL